MKLYSNKIDQLFDLIHRSKIQGLLLYGPEDGIVSWIIKQIEKKFEFLVESVDCQSIDEVCLEMHSTDFFNAKKILKIKYKSSLIKDVENLVQTQNIHFPIVIAEDIPSNNALRKFFENHENLASIPCYPDNTIGLNQFITSILMNNKKKIEKSALEYLVDNCYGNRMIIVNELAKLDLYLINEEEYSARQNSKAKNIGYQVITIEDVQKVVNLKIIPVIDELIFAFLFQNLGLYFKILAQIQDSSIEFNFIVRVFIRYALQLYEVKKSVAAHMSKYNIQLYKSNKSSININNIENSFAEDLDMSSLINNAISKLTPPIFFANVTKFKNAVVKLSLDQIISMMNMCYDLEKNFKLQLLGHTTSAMTKFYFEWSKAK